MRGLFVFHVGHLEIELTTFYDEETLSGVLSSPPFYWKLTGCGTDCIEHEYGGHASTWDKAREQAITTAAYLLPPRRRDVYLRSLLPSPAERAADRSHPCAE